MPVLPTATSTAASRWRTTRKSAKPSAPPTARHGFRAVSSSNAVLLGPAASAAFLAPARSTSRTASFARWPGRTSDIAIRGVPERRSPTTVTWCGFASVRSRPRLRVFSAPLPPDSEVQFNHGAVASVDLRSNAARFRGCTFDLIMVEKGKTVGRTTGTCTLPIPRGNLYVPLPATAIGRS